MNTTILETLTNMTAGWDEITFNPEWSNGTGYFDGAVTASIEAPSKSSDQHGRKIFIIPTLVGNVIVFQRYAGDEDVFASNKPSCLNGVIPSGAWKSDNIWSFVADAGIASIVAGIVKTANKMAEKEEVL